MFITFETKIAEEELVRVSCEHTRIVLIEKNGDPSDIVDGITTNFRAWVDHDEFFLSEKEFFNLKTKLECAVEIKSNYALISEERFKNMIDDMIEIESMGEQNLNHTVNTKKNNYCSR